MRLRRCARVCVRVRGCEQARLLPLHGAHAHAPSCLRWGC